jgi:hypothetical protein
MATSKKQSSEEGWNVHYSVLDCDANDVVGSYVDGPYTVDEAIEKRRKMAAQPGIISVYLARGELKRGELKR